MYAILDLFTQPQVKECYLDCLWGGGRFGVFARIDQFPGAMKRSWAKQELPDEFPTKGLSWNTLNEPVITDVLEPERTAKNLTARFLSWVGVMHYEDGLRSFDPRGWLAHT
ncbi:hypothetical protein MTMBA_05990 [Moorella thermoacetica]